MPEKNPTAEVAVRETVAIEIADKGTVHVPAEIAERFPAIGGFEELAELMTEVFGDSNATIGIGDLVRVKVPAEGAVAFTVGEDPQKTIKGVIIVRQPRRNLWIKSISETGGGDAPDCYSRDGENGIGAFGRDSNGNPSGKCAECPMAQWSEDLDGKRVPSPCKPQEAVLIMTEEGPFPLLLTVPRTSIRPFADYWKRDLFMRKMKPLMQVVTEIGLKPAVSESGQRYNEITFTMAEDLGKDTKKVMAHLAEQFRSILLNVDTSGADANNGPSTVGAVRLDDEELTGVTLDSELIDDETPVAG